MQTINYGSNPTVAILIKGSYFNHEDLSKHYIKPIQADTDVDCLAVELPYPSNKITVSQARKEIQKILPALSHAGIQYLYVADATYFKALTGQTKADTHLGYVLPCKLKGYEHLYVVLGINYGQLIYNPNVAEKLELSIQTLTSHIKGNYTARGDIIQTALYPQTEHDIELALANLHQHPVLTCDIETTGLTLGSQLFSIAFAYNQHEGIAFVVQNKTQLKRFFERYRGTLVFHNATFDIKHIIFNLFMSHPRDYHGMLHGLHTMCKSIHDTKIIAYLALNSTAGNNLGLKDLSHEFTGNYAIDVKNVLAHPPEVVLEYNLKDTLATFYVYNKYLPKMLKDNQESIYHTVMLPSIKTIVQIELCGMPMNMAKVVEARHKLESISSTALQTIQSSKHTQAVLRDIQRAELDKINAKLKTKQHGFEKVADIQFNPNSNNHLGLLLYHSLNLPVLDYTATKQPAVGSSTIKKLINHTTDESVLELLNALIEYSSAQKVLSTFIPAFEAAMPKDGWHYLHGNFNLGGTLSNRLSSSDPNLQNLPSGSEYGKLVKQCFSAPADWLFVGSDFASLEDRANALLTKDSNKLKVYTDGFDGHSLRAYSYWPHLMPDIRQATNDEICYEAKVGDSMIYFKNTDTIHYQGTTYTGAGFYELVSSQGL